MSLWKNIWRILTGMAYLVAIGFAAHGANHQTILLVWLIITATAFIISFTLDPTTKAEEKTHHHFDVEPLLEQGYRFEKTEGGWKLVAPDNTKEDN